jgi:tape measure domain-containing protein
MAHANRRFTQEQARVTDAGGRQAGEKFGKAFESSGGRSVGHGSKIMGGALLGIGHMAVLGAGGAVAALATVGGAGAIMGAKVASGNEQARISFGTMLGSAQKADKFLRQLQQFAATTPFEFPELQTAASSLISSGIEADKVIPIMRTLGDVTSGMGTGAEGVQRATVALQQMSAAGRITGEDLNQLRDAGIPVFDLLSKATGKSKAEIVKLAQAGKLGKSELDAMMKALESGAGLERFSGLMDKQSKSLAGMASTLKDTMGQGLANAVAPLFPMLKAGLGGVSDAFAAINPVLVSFGKVTAAAFGAFGDSLSGGESGVRSLADFLNTHQGDLTGFMVEGGKAAIQLGQALAAMASVGLRAFAGLASGMNTAGNAVMALEARIVENFANIQDALGFDKAAAKARAAAQSIRGEIEKNNASDPGKFARDLADTIDTKMRPALSAAQRGLERVGKTEIAKAKQRDDAAKLALLVDNIGTKANGSQLKLRTFADVTKLSAREQRGLHNRIREAAAGLRDQVTAARRAGDGQKALTKTWETGKRRLYDEFRQMGLSKAEAKRLAAQYAGVKPKVRTKFEQPGMAKSRSDVRGLDRDVNNLNNKKITITAAFHATADKAVAKLNKNIVTSRGGRQIRVFARGGHVDGPGHGTSDEVPAMLSRGEVVIREKAVRKFGKRRLLAINQTGELPHFAAGGVVTVAGRDNIAHVNPNAYNGSAAALGTSGEAYMRRLANAYARQLSDSMGGGPGGPVGGHIDMSNPRGLTAYNGHTFTNLFAANLRAAEQKAGHRFRIFQGGFRPSTSYSGSTHNKDAIDAQVDLPLLRAFRSLVGAMGDRTGLGNWASHMHGVPAPGHGYGSPSAQAQYRDYIRRGGGSQSVHSSWGLHAGTLSAMPGVRPTAEKGAELVVNPSLKRYRGGEVVYDAGETKDLLAAAQRGLKGGHTVVQNFPVVSVAAAVTAANRAVLELQARGLG